MLDCCRSNDLGQTFPGLKNALGRDEVGRQRWMPEDFSISCNRLFTMIQCANTMQSPRTKILLTGNKVGLHTLGHHNTQQYITCDQQISRKKGKGKGMVLDIAPLNGAQ